MTRTSNSSSLRHYLIIGVLLAVSLALAGFNYRIWNKREDKEKQVDQLKAELESAREQKKNMEVDLEKVQNKPHIERTLREDFLMKKPGEKKVIILTEEEKEKRKKEKAKEEETNWEKFLEGLSR